MPYLHDFSENGSLFSCFVFSGKRDGKGVMKYDLEDMSFYDGDWVDNNKCGYGVRRYAEFDFSDR